MFGHGGKSELLSRGSSGATPGSSTGARDDPAALHPFGRRSSRQRPVLLATLSVRVDPSAERIAIDCALEARTSLIVANMIMLPNYPTTLMLAPQYATLPHEEDLEAVRATAERAAARGIKTELLRISCRRPVRALVELARDRSAGLLVFGPDLRRTARIRFRIAARRVRREAPCLVWIAPDG